MRVLPFVLAAVLGVAAAGLVACGSGGGNRSDLIPQRSADRMKSALSDVRSAVQAGECANAEQAISRARGVLVNLPSSVDNRLVARLQQGLDNLDAVAPRECARTATQTTTQDTTTTTAPDTTPQDTTPTDTTPSDTTTTDTTPPDTTTTPSDTTTTAPPATTTTQAPADTSGGATTP